MNFFLFGIYPYIAMSVFIIGCIMRYNSSQRDWGAKSSQFLENNHFWMKSTVFHISLVLLVLVHIVGLCTPPFIYELFITPATKQLLAIFVGGFIGIVCFISITALVIRRLFKPRIFLTSSPMDIIILLLIYLELFLGVLSLPFSYKHLDGENLQILASWTRHILTFQSNSAELVLSQEFIYKAHIFLGFTIFLLFPFSRLVHALSFPITFLFRSYTQIVRSLRKL